MENIYPFIKPNYVARNGLTPLYVKYNYNRNKRTLISTGFNVKPEYWDSRKKWIKRCCPEFEEIDLMLKNIVSKVGEILIFAKENSIDPTVDFLLAEIERNREYRQRSGKLNMLEILDLYIEEKNGMVSASQIKDYRTLKKHIQTFREHSSQPVTFKNLNLKFYNEFMDYLFYKARRADGSTGLLTNSAGKIVRLLKGFVNYEVAKGTIPATDLSCFKVVEEETDAIFLSEAELDTIYNLDLSDSRELREVRDLFIVGCFTGLRYSDLSSLSLEHIDLKSGNITLKQRKVHKAVIIPMIDYVPEILLKYRYELPKVPSYAFNERIKEVGKRAGLRQKIEVVRRKGIQRVDMVFEKWEMISSHTCRRSFCTNMYLSGFPAEELMRISGHKSPAAFMRYIKVDNLQAANRLKELRNSLKK